MKEYFLKLYRYNAWSNKRVLGALEQQNVTDEKILMLMSHVMAAQLLWLHRILGLPAPDVELWKRYSIDRLKELSEEGSIRWLQFIEGQDDFNRPLRYHNYVGQSFENNIEHIMIHTVNHATYHRGQVALLMRERGYEPINTDFITYDRVITGQMKA